MILLICGILKKKKNGNRLIKTENCIWCIAIEDMDWGMGEIGGEYLGIKFQLQNK